jgi:ribbon-helix-helix CopG family protein
MRTTITLDPDVAAKLKREARDRGVSFKQALNSSVRRGLSGGGATPRPYQAPTRRLGARPGLDLDRALSLAAGLEDAETARKLSLRK